MTHMQSTFAPAAMVFPNYPVMGYMHHQSTPAVCQHPVPGQSWMTMQPHKPGGNINIFTVQRPKGTMQNEMRENLDKCV